jgi:hypothetical protein
MRSTRFNDRRDCRQPPNRLVRFVKLSHMRIASREKPVCGCPASMLLERSEQHRRSVRETLGEKVAHANCHECTRPASVRAEPQRSLEMANCGFGLTRPQPQPTTYHPTASKAGVECQSTVDQFDSGIDVFAKIGESVRSPAEDTRIVIADPKRLPGEIDPLAAV